MRRLLACATISMLLPSAAAWAQDSAATGGIAEPVLTALGAGTPPPARTRALTQARAAKACVDMDISCNSSGTGTLATDDCFVDDGIYADFWVFQGAAGQTVTIDAGSNQFDTWIFLFDPPPSPDIVADDDDGGPGTDSRLVYTLDRSGEWAIAVTNYEENVLGTYFISLGCTTTQVDPPAAPSDLTATALSSTEIELGWQDNSDNEDEFRVEIRSGAQSFQEIGGVGPDSIGAFVSGLAPSTPYDFRVRARNAAGNSPYSNQASATTLPAGPGCTPSATTHCLLEGRFRVEVEWRDFEGNVGPGMVVDLGPFQSDDSGLFYFFDPDNWEMLVKMVDTCGSPFDNFWVFSAATTDVEYTLRVTDTQRDRFNEYFNPLGNAAPAITDTSAFPTCP